MWPFLLEHMTEHVARLSPAQRPSQPSVKLGSRVSQGESYYVDFSVNVPKPGPLAAKFFLVQAMQLS